MTTEIDNKKIFNFFNILKELGIEICYSHKNSEENFKRTIIVGVRGSKLTNSLQPEDYKMLRKSFEKDLMLKCIEIKDGLKHECEIYFLPSLLPFKKLLEMILGD